MHEEDSFVVPGYRTWNIAIRCFRRIYRGSVSFVRGPEERLESKRTIPGVTYLAKHRESGEGTRVESAFQRLAIFAVIVVEFRRRPSQRTKTQTAVFP